MAKIHITKATGRAQISTSVTITSHLTTTRTRPATISMNAQRVVMEEQSLELPVKDFVMFSITEAASTRKL